METQTRSNPRTCVGCKKTAPRRELLRFVRDGAAVTADVRGRRAGRGAWVHPKRECLSAASAHGFSRSFRTSIRANDLASAAEACRVEVDRVLDGLRRQGALVTDSAGLERAASNERAVVLHAADALFRGETHARRFAHRDQQTLAGIAAVSALAIEREDEARRVVSLLERAIALSEDA
jgi:hypothetical protein